MQVILKIMLLFIIIACPLAIVAQEDEEVPFEEVDTILNKIQLKKERSGGGTIHTLGWGGIYRQGTNVTAFRKVLWEVEAVGMRSHKQVRVNFYGAYYSNAYSYVYGKLNKVFVVRGGLGQQHLITRKPYWGGIEIRAAYYGGLSVGIAKPVYLQIINQTSYNVITTERYDPEKHFIENIYGRAPFFDGIQNTTFYPGIYLKAGLNFEFGQYNTSIKALEAGIVADGYPFPIPIMAFTEKHYYFLNLYLSVTFGKRYNKF